MADLLEQLKGALADRYLIDHEIGRGGMATVYLAEDLKHHRKVAIKVLRPELSASLFAERFLREIEITANLNHPHILPLLDSGEADGSLYYVMPLVEGESLRDRLAREKQLPIDDAVKIASEVADALGYAHGHNVIHRDVKPENILLEAGHAVVADFGIARAVSEAGGERLTETGIAVGTPSYLSPEQAAGESDLDGRSDVYSLGCVLHEMLTGEPPFTGPNAENIIRKHISAEPTPVSVVRSTVSDEITLTVQKTLAKSPADRQQTAADLLSDLATDRLAVSKPVNVKRRRWTVVAAAIAIVAMVVVALTVVLTSGTESGGPPSVAVLPFVNITGSPEDEYISDGITVEIINQLAKIADLKVKSRTSAMRYKNTEKSLEQIGEELGVDAVVEGEVLRSGDEVRINAQLIDVDSDAHLWSDRYERQSDDVLTLQSEIALLIATALNAVLTPEEVERIESRATDSDSAYDLYLRASDHYRAGSPADGAEKERHWRQAIELYQQAVEADPEFAVAHAQLGWMHLRMYWHGIDRTEGRVQLGKLSVDRAIALDPDLGEAYLALGYYHYWANRDVERALAAFEEASRLMPGDLRPAYGLGIIQTRLGRFAESVRHLEDAFGFDPTAGRAHRIGHTYAAMRKNVEAISWYERGWALGSGSYVHARVAQAYMRLGNLQAARTAIARASDSRDAHVITAGFSTEAYSRDFEAAAAWLARETGRLLTFQGGRVPIALYWGHLYRWTGREADARRSYGEAVTSLETLGIRGSELAVAYAALGSREAALALIDTIATYKRQLRDLYVSAVPWEGMAQVYVLLGEHDMATEVLEQLLDMEYAAALTQHDLRLSPWWDPLREHPRFQALLSEN